MVKGTLIILNCSENYVQKIGDCFVNMPKSKFDTSMHPNEKDKCIAEIFSKSKYTYINFKTHHLLE